MSRHRINYSLDFILGWDGETAGAFQATLDLLQDPKVPVAYFNILMPVKGNPLYNRLQSQSRIMNSQEIEDDRFAGREHFHGP